MTNTAGLRALFKIKDGDIFDTEAIRKGLESLRKAYAALGYINFTPVPNTEADDEKKLITLRIDLDEGKQFFVRRIEFQGNTTTRDKVIRRELALEEGQVYNGNLWELSLLRLNQLQYFEALKPEQDSEIKQNVQDATVDITLKVKEKGKNSIGLTGGVSGLSGGFHRPQLHHQQPVRQRRKLDAAVPGRPVPEERDASRFTQPYLFDRPLQFGWSVYHSSYNYNQAALTQIQLNQTSQPARKLSGPAAELHPDEHGFHDFAELSHQALVQAGRHHLFVRRLVGADVQRRRRRITLRPWRSAASPAPTRSMESSPARSCPISPTTGSTTRSARTPGRACTLPPNLRVWAAM